MYQMFKNTETNTIICIDMCIHTQLLTSLYSFTKPFWNVSVWLSSENVMWNEKLLVANYIVRTLVPLEVDIQIMKLEKYVD
jgi:hypothetical protein